MKVGDLIIWKKKDGFYGKAKGDMVLVVQDMPPRPDFDGTYVRLLPLNHKVEFVCDNFVATTEFYKISRTKVKICKA
jgi:hypothetical protein